MQTGNPLKKIIPTSTKPHYKIIVIQNNTNEAF